MTQRLLIAVLTVLVFGAGYGARLWTERHAAVPPAPALGSEFIRPANGDAAKKAGPRPFDRAKLVAEIEQLRPQIEAYRTRLDAIDSEFEESFLKILSPEQRLIHQQKQNEYQKRRAEREKAAATLPPLSDEEIAKLRQRPFEIAFWTVSFAGRLDRCTRDYKLDEKQQASTRDLLRARREKFIALVDATPPPTVRLTLLVSSLPRLTEPTTETTAK